MQNKWYKWLIILIFQWILWKILYKIEWFVEFWFNYPIRYYQSIINSITSPINFPIGEFLYGVLAFFGLRFLLTFLKKNNFQQRITDFLKLLSVVIFIYNSLWGIVYHKTTFHIPEMKIKTEQLKELYCTTLENAKKSRQKFNSTTQPLAFTTNKNQILQEFELNQKQIAQEDWIINYHWIKHINVKESNVSTLLNYIGILGYYNPFSIESNSNRYNTDLKTAYTIHHELAHQMGFASEAEANFIAYYYGIHSKYAEVNYSAYYKLMFSLLNAIQASDPLFVKTQMDSLPLEIKNDRKAEIEFYKKYDGQSNEIFSELNNQFLKANNQEGIISYSKYINLVLHYYTKKG